MRLWVPLLLAGALCAQSKMETGDINGAKFRIDVPEKWNGGLVMYCHGYSPVPVTYDRPEVSPVLKTFLDQGYAVAQSGYATGGWAIQEAVVDTEGLRRYFVKKYGPAKETYITGHSMGGFLTMVLMETYPAVYDAGMPLCGPLAPTMSFIGRGAFDSRVLFDYYFPGVFPDPSKTPSSYRNNREEVARLKALLDGSEAKAAVLRRQNGIKTNQDMAATLVFLTAMFAELQARAGGNPFDNRNIIYSNTDDDNAVNTGVKRYAADPKAAEYLRTFYTPTGRITKPMLAIHTSYDALVPVNVPNQYQTLADNAGTANLFVQQYVKRDGHCQITPEETARGFSLLREWKSSGVRPPAGDQAAVAAGGSR